LQEFEIIIVGAGPAGLSAGIYVARQNVSCLVISKDLGGQMNLIPRLENYPGAIMSSGPILAKTLETQYLSFKGEIVYDTVEKIDETEGGFEIKTTRSKYKAKQLCWHQAKYQICWVLKMSHNILTKEFITVQNVMHRFTKGGLQLLSV